MPNRHKRAFFGLLVINLTPIIHLTRLIVPLPSANFLPVGRPPKTSPTNARPCRSPGTWRALILRTDLALQSSAASSPGVRRLFFHFADDRNRRNLHSPTQSENGVHGGHSVTALNERNITHVQVRGLGESLLRDAGIRPESGNDSPNNRLQIGMFARVQAAYRSGSAPTTPLTIVREFLAAGPVGSYDLR